MQRVADCARSVEAAGIRVERIVVGGSPGFIPDLRELVVRHRVDAQVDVSPGTWVYWDSNYAAKMPGMFEIAALVLAQVMDLPGDGLATLNLGYKRWSIDQGPVQLFSDGLGLGRIVGNVAARHRNAVAPEQLLGLIFVNIHGLPPQASVVA